jgi:hypothetical protein
MQRRTRELRECRRAECSFPSEILCSSGSHFIGRVCKVSNFLNVRSRAALFRGTSASRGEPFRSLSCSARSRTPGLCDWRTPFSVRSTASADPTRTLMFVSPSHLSKDRFGRKWLVVISRVATVGCFPYLSRRAMVCGAGCRVGVAGDGSSQNGAGGCRAQVESGARQAWSTRSGGGEFELAEGVVGAFADLAGDGEPGHGCVAPLAGGAVEGEVGGGWPVRVHGRFVECPAKVW